MTPPCEPFTASELLVKVQENVDGKRRKMVAGQRRIDLTTCELFEIPQYKCEVQQPVTETSIVQCNKIERFFRRCRDKKGTFMVETTAWERAKSPEEGAPTAYETSKPPSRPYVWSTDDGVSPS